MKIISKKKFVKIAINNNIEVYLVYITSFSLKLKIIIYLVKKVKIAYLSIQKIFKCILIIYLNFVYTFLKKLAIKLLKYISINKLITNIKIDKQLFYRLIYSFEFIKLETFKIYIKTNLINSLI